MEPILYKEDEQPVELFLDPPAIYGCVSVVNLDPNKRYSYADYLTWADNKRRELFDGMVKMMSGPNTWHSRITVGLVGKIWPFVKKRKGTCEVFHSPIDVRLPRNGETADNKVYTVVQPDICVVCEPSKIDEKGIIGAPDLVVEVQSPSTGKVDMSTKFDLYEEAGVKEYWVVHPINGLTVFLLQENGKFDDGATYDLIYTPNAKVPMRTIKGLEIELKELLSGLF